MSFSDLPPGGPLPGSYDDPPPPRGLAAWPRAAQWAALAALSAGLWGAMEAVGLPAAALLGPMIASIILSVRDARIRLPHRLFLCAQGVVGCMVGAAIPAETLPGIVRDWPVFLGGVMAVIGAAAALGWALARRQVLPGTTAVWGSAPGAASAMVLLSSSYGADMRLVAVMQYLRVVMVSASAAVVTALVIGGADAGEGAPARAPTDWLPALDLIGLGMTAAVVAASLAAGRLLRIPAAPFLLPLLFTAALQAAGGPVPAQPPWLLIAAYACTGWAIGQRFNGAILAHAARALPRLALSILGLIVLCAGFGAALSVVADVDPLTAFLATSPGGADSVAIIAAHSDVDVPFVMAMQTARFIAVLALGPFIARFIAARVRPRGA